MFHKFKDYSWVFSINRASSQRVWNGPVGVRCRPDRVDGRLVTCLPCARRRIAPSWSAQDTADSLYHFLIIFHGVSHRRTLRVWILDADYSGQAHLKTLPEIYDSVPPKRIILQPQVFKFSTFQESPKIHFCKTRVAAVERALNVETFLDLENWSSRHRRLRVHIRRYALPSAFLNEPCIFWAAESSFNFGDRIFYWQGPSSPMRSISTLSLTMI